MNISSLSLTFLASSSFLLSKSRIILRWKLSQISREDTWWIICPCDGLVYRMVCWGRVMMEQFNNLYKYFLRVLPIKERFNGKYRIGASDQYKRIKKTLNNKMLTAVCSHFLCSEFQKFYDPLKKFLMDGSLTKNT